MAEGSDSEADGINAANEPPPIEHELAEAGETFRETRGANGGELGSLAREAKQMGMPLDAIAFKSGVEAGTVQTLIASTD